MFFQRFIEPSLAIFSYMIGDPKTRRCAVIDPVLRPEMYMHVAAAAQLQITDILETHVHADFLSGSQELKELLQGRPTIHCSAEGGKEWMPAYADRQVHDGDVVVLGDWKLKAFHTPGHTPEHLAWLVFDDARSKDVPCFAFTGDLLFVGGVGRPDLLGPAQTSVLAHALYDTLFRRLKSLPDFIEIFPTHGAGSWCGNQSSTRSSSTLGYELRFNPWLIPKSEGEWTDALLKTMPAAPPYVVEVKKLNLAKREAASMPIQQKIAKISNQGNLIIDIRLPEDFAAKHLKGAVNLPWSPTFTYYASCVLPYHISLSVVGADSAAIEQSIEQLRLIGHRVNAFALLSPHDQGEWDNFPIVDVSKVQQDRPFVLDVRRNDEWNEGHIPWAEHIELGSVQQKMAALPKDRCIYVTCRSGYRASIAASLLQHEGFNVANIRGGMQAWRAQRFPVA